MSCCATTTRQGRLASAQPPDVNAGWARLAAAAFLAGNSMALSLAINVAEASQQDRRILHSGLALAAALVALFVGKPLAQAALASVKRRAPGVEALFICALFGAAVSSAVSVWRAKGPVYFEVIGLLLVIFAWGQKLKQTSQLRVMRTLREQIPTSRRCTRVDPVSGAASECLRSEIRAQDSIQLLPGDIVPVDGVVTVGRAFYNTASMTGEGFCTALTVGAQVSAGMQVIDAPVVIKAAVDAPHSQIDSMAKDIISGLVQRSAWERLADRWAKRLLPTVLAVSIATFAYWSVATSLDAGLINAMAVLLVACPCALSFATPTAVWASVIALARLGLYTRNTSAIERLAQVDTLIFDKTGTLTEVTTGVQAWIFASQSKHTPSHIKALASAAQRLSSHPIAKAFYDPQVSTFRDISPKQVVIYPGVGLSVKLALHDAEIEIFLGEASLYLDAAQMCTWLPLVEQLDPALRAVCIVIDGQVAAAAGLADKIAIDVGGLCARASKLELTTHIYSGDSQARVDLLKHPSAQGQMHPVDKRSGVVSLQKAGRRVCFVGDGINDAPAMAVSHVSMAVDQGAALAADAADFILPQACLAEVVASVAVARRMHSIIEGNLRIALTYNAIAMSVAALGFIHPVFAAFMMLASSLTVTLRVARHIA